MYKVISFQYGYLINLVLYKEQVQVKQKGAVKSIEKLMKKTEEKLEKTIEKGEIAKGSVGFKEVRKKSWYERCGP